MATSFAPKDFGRAAWHGGQAILTEPVFRYRSFTPTTGKNAGNEVKLVTAYMEYVDPEGNNHRAQYDVGSAEYCQIKSGPGEGADSTEQGTSIANPDPTRDYKVSPDSDFGKFLSSLVNGGFDESLLLEGDITVFDGVELEIFEQPRRENDKFPLLLVKPSSIKGKRQEAKKAAAAGSDNVKAVADEFVERFLLENGGTVTQAALVKGSMNDPTIKASGQRKEVVPLMNNRSYLSDSETWAYDAAEKTLTYLG